MPFLKKFLSSSGGQRRVNANGNSKSSSRGAAAAVHTALVNNNQSLQFTLDVADRHDAKREGQPKEEAPAAGKQEEKVSIQFNLEELLDASSCLLKNRETESSLTPKEVSSALKTYQELTRILTLATRTGDWMSKPPTTSTTNGTSSATTNGSIAQQQQKEHQDDKKWDDFLQEFESAETALQKTMALHPTMVRPLSLDVVEQEVTRDLFILDNSLRETTVGAPKGHSLEEKYKIIQSMIDDTNGSGGGTGIQEVILGSFGSKISVDSQIAARWKSLGQSFDSTWGFSDAYDMAGFDEQPLWDALPKFIDAVDSGKVGPGREDFHFVTPPAQPLADYSKDDVALLEKAAEGFAPNAFGKKKLKQVLKESTSKEHGRIPLGLIMMAGYGICNAIVEVDTTLETFDYSKYNVIERCKFLLRWCKENLPQRQQSSGLKEGDDGSPRVLINLRDFTNFQRTPDGLKNALQLVDALCRLPPSILPFGFMMEEPSGWLLPKEVAKLCRMVRLTMQRAGFPEGRFLVHVHMAFGLADATQLACLANGADGIWAAVSRTGAQVGHACSTITAVNLFRLGHREIAQKYNLANMVRAARAVTEITTRSPCPTHEEVYGTLAFDIPYVMTNLPACRYTLALLVKELEIDRTVRLNELSSPYAVMMAMQQQFGLPQEIGWDPTVCPIMWDAIHNHLMTGLSRDYNTKIGLGNLYALASQKALPTQMVAIMMKDSTVPDTHPTILEFIQRWNRLCLQYEEGNKDSSSLPQHPQQASPSIMMWNTDYTTTPIRNSLPFDYYKADHIRNVGMKRIPKLMRLYMLRSVVRDERKIQNKRNPKVLFYDQVMRLKLFIQEAEDKNFLPLVDDFCLQRGLESFFGDEYTWLDSKRGLAAKALRRKALGMMKKNVKNIFVPMVQEEANQNTAFGRHIEFFEKRLLDDQEIGAELQDIRKELLKFHHLKLQPLPPPTSSSSDEEENDDALQSSTRSKVINPAHRQIIQDLLGNKEAAVGGGSDIISQEFDSAFLQEKGFDDDAMVDLDLAYFGKSSNAKAQALIQKMDEDDEIMV